MTTDTNTSTIADALSAYRDACRERDAWRDELAPALEHMDSLNQAVDTAKRAITDAMTADGIDYAEDDSFAVSLVQSDRGAYNADKLPKSQAVLDACTLAIDKHAVERLVKRRVLTEEQARAAWESKPAAPYVKVSIKR